MSHQENSISDSGEPNVSHVISTSSPRPPRCDSPAALLVVAGLVAPPSGRTLADRQVRPPLGPAGPRPVQWGRG